MAFQTPTGTADFLPETAARWLAMQAIAAEIFGRYGYLPFESPTFEHLEVFARGIGEATDVVGKEMFLVFSQQNVEAMRKGEDLPVKDALALRPEGTAGATRAIVQHALVPQGSTALKIYYAGPMFRYERPQKGRLREFHQIGAECIGAAEASADAEVIEMLMCFFAELGIPREAMRLKLNSMGDDQCRPAYRDSIRDFILSHKELCPDCQRRAYTNPLRAFDCKNDRCAEIMTEAPRITDALCPDCAEHYATVKHLLAGSQISYEEDHRLVRGLDYYTRTVFEVQVNTGLGSQNAIGGGGRYDKLIEMLDGNPTPGLGFAVGFERISLVLDEIGATLGELPTPTVYVAAVDSSCRDAAFALASQLRQSGISVELDHQGRSLKSQFKSADKTGASFVVILGPDELASGKATIRVMSTGEERQLAIEELVTAINEQETAAAGQLTTSWQKPSGL